MHDYLKEAQTTTRKVFLIVFTCLILVLTIAAAGYKKFVVDKHCDHDHDDKEKQIKQNLIDE
jgi:hypothetical protein